MSRLRIGLLMMLAALTGCDVTFTVHEATAEPGSAVAIEAASGKSGAAAPTPVEPRPDWVDAPPGLHGGNYETTVLVGPETSRAACEAKLAPVVEAAVADYVLREYGPAASKQIDLSRATLRREVVAAVWEEPVAAGDQTGTFLHAQLRFNDRLRAKWQQAVDAWTTTTRTLELVRGAALALAAVGAVHIGLRLAGLRKATA